MEIPKPDGGVRLLFTWDEKPRIWIAPKAMERLKERIRGLTERSRGISMRPVDLG